MARVDLGRVVGDSAYEVAVKEGFVGSEQEWLDSLKGADGAVGPQGPAGEQGETGPQGPAGDDGSQVSVSSTGISTNEVQYITIDGTEYKLAGSSEPTDSILYDVDFLEYDPETDYDDLVAAEQAGKLIRLLVGANRVMLSRVNNDGVFEFRLPNGTHNEDDDDTIMLFVYYLDSEGGWNDTFRLGGSQPGPGPSWDWEYTWVTDENEVEASISDDGHTVEFINFNFTDTPYLFMPTSMADITVGANGGPNQNANGEFDMSQDGYIMGDAQADWSIYCDASNQKLVLKSPGGGPDFHNFNSFYVSGKANMAQE